MATESQHGKRYAADGSIVPHVRTPRAPYRTDRSSLPNRSRPIWGT
jgi:hypothetical protein